MRHRATNPSSSHDDNTWRPSGTHNAVTAAARREQRPPHSQPSNVEPTKEFLLVFVTTICVGWWLILAYKYCANASITSTKYVVNQRMSVFQSAKILDPTSELKLPTPIIVVGLPKVGTTSIAAYFRCGRIASSHFSCEVAKTNADASPSISSGADSWRNCRLPPTHGTDAGSFPLCAVCVERNILRGRPPLEGCGPYDVFAELDSAEHPLPSSSTTSNLRSLSSFSLSSSSAADIQPLCSYPQITHLDSIRKAYPNATFILNTRPVGHWIRSISRWNANDKQKEGVGYLRQVLVKCDLPGLPSGIGSRDEELASFYHAHSMRIRNFVRKHRHALVEIDIEADETALAMEEAFGISSECWNQHNPTMQEKRDGPVDDDDDGANANDALQFPKEDSREENEDFVFQKEKPDTPLVLDYVECENIEDIFPKVKIK